MSVRYAAFAWSAAIACAASVQAEPAAHAREIPAAQLRAAIDHARDRAPGMAWVDYLTTPDASVTVVRRTGQGRAEVHRLRSDVWYVIKGSGTLTTGGTLIASKQTEPNELRGSAIEGGRANRIGPGDMVLVPAGLPHWVSKVDGKQLVYLVVKIPATRSAGGAR